MNKIISFHQVGKRYDIQITRFGVKLLLTALVVVTGAFKQPIGLMVFGAVLVIMVISDFFEAVL